MNFKPISRPGLSPWNPSQTPAGRLHAIPGPETEAGSRRGLSRAMCLTGIVLAFLSGASHGISPTNDHFWSYHGDGGAAYGKRANGMAYGWNGDNKTGVDRNSPLAQDDRYDRSLAMQEGGDFKWEMEVPNGTYRVLLVAGDPGATDAVYRMNLEDKLALEGVPSSEYPWVSAMAEVKVTDGKLTLSNAPGAKKNRINYIHVTSPGQGLSTPIGQEMPGLPKWLMPAVHQQSGSFVISNALEGDIVSLSDLSGRIIVEQRISSPHAVMNTFPLPQGIYLLRYRRQGQSLLTARLPVTAGAPSSGARR